MKLIGWRRLNKNGLAGFATVELEIGLKFFECPVYASGRHGPWCALPGKPVIEGGHHKTLGDGRLVYAPCAEWVERSMSDKFSRQVLALVRAKDPEALPPEEHTR